MAEDEKDPSFDDYEREMLSRLLARHIGDVLASYHHVQLAGGSERPKFCFALFLFPEQSLQAALITNSTRAFAIEMCKEFLAAEAAMQTNEAVAASEAGK